MIGLPVQWFALNSWDLKPPQQYLRYIYFVNWLTSKMSLRSVRREYQNAFWGSRTHHVRQSILPSTVWGQVWVPSPFYIAGDGQRSRKEVFRSELLMFSDILWLKDRQGHITGRLKSDIFFWTLLYLTCVSCSLLLHLSLRCSYFYISFIQSPRSDKIGVWSISITKSV